MFSSIKITILNAPEDRDILEILKKHLTSIKRNYNASIFDESQIRGGENRVEKLKEEIQQAHIIIALWSVDLISSEPLYELLECAHKLCEEKAKIFIPIKARDCIIDRPFDELQILPRNQQPLGGSNEQPYIEVTKELGRIVQNLKSDYEKNATPLIWLTAKIGLFTPNFRNEEFVEALPDGLTMLQPVKIHFPNFDKSQDKDYWMNYAHKIKQKIDTAIHAKKILPQHLFIFGLAPIPLLIYLGSCIGDKIPSTVFPVNRDVPKNKRLCWRESNTPEFPSYTIKTIQTSSHKHNVALLLEISDRIAEDKYNTVLDDTFTIYSISLEQPTKYYLKCEQQLFLFAQKFTTLLNNIQAKHGRTTPIHILPAIPTAISIKMGLCLLPTKDPPLWIYDYAPQTGFKKVLSI